MKTENTSWKDPKATTDQLLRSMCESLHWLNVNMERLITNTDKLLKAQTAEQVLAERRERDAKRMRNVREQKLTEREGEEQENLPPTPPIREKEDQEKDCVSPRAREADLDVRGAKEAFEAFWFAYPGPRKVDKRKCREKYVKLAKENKYNNLFYQKVFAGLNRWKACTDWTRDNGKFICAPLVWLNNERWDADVKSVAPVVDMRNRPDNYLAPSAEEIEEIKKLF